MTDEDKELAKKNFFAAYNKFRDGLESLLYRDGSKGYFYTDEQKQSVHFLFYNDIEAYFLSYAPKKSVDGSLEPSRYRVRTIKELLEGMIAKHLAFGLLDEANALQEVAKKLHYELNEEYIYFETERRQKENDTTEMEFIG